MASSSSSTASPSDGLDNECVVQRGRSQSDPSSITEVRSGETHGPGKRIRGGRRLGVFFFCFFVSFLFFSRLMPVNHVCVVACSVFPLILCATCVVMCVFLRCAAGPSRNTRPPLLAPSPHHHDKNVTEHHVGISGTVCAFCHASITVPSL